MNNQWIEDISSMRKDYMVGSLEQSAMNPDPLVQFREWFKQAKEIEKYEANSMFLATADKNGIPSCRIVLLKRYGPDGFVFFTNFESRKAGEIQENPNAALCFYWPELQRQLRVEGKVKMLADSESDAYFNSRPPQSRLGAWASEQSKKINSKEDLISKLKEVENRFGDNNISRPPFWGGYVLNPEKIEFWQGGSNRLHDRFLYEKTQSEWTLSRLAP